mgnify:CR=1 FL=1
MWRGHIFSVLLVLSCETSYAKDLGIRGEVFPVAEPDLFSEIQSKFDRLEAAGEVDRLNERFRDRAIAAAERPPHVEGISNTVTPRSYLFDPTITVRDEIRTPDGTVLARAGDQFNPLDFTSMRQRLVFFDGDVPAQVEWARLEFDQSEEVVQPILIGGPVLELSRDWKRQVFFDQGGKLSSMFGIAHVPARVTREGNRLLVEEVLP